MTLDIIKRGSFRFHLSNGRVYFGGGKVGNAGNGIGDTQRPQRTTANLTYGGNVHLTGYIRSQNPEPHSERGKLDITGQKTHGLD